MLDREDGGYFSGYSPAATAGMLYGFRLDGEEKLYPDPASRLQPAGPHELSEIVDPSTFDWTDGQWKGISPARQVIYELHVGTFTDAGTLAAATKELQYLSELGITVVELMPLAEFDGHFGWGYDGVNLFAPTRNYGSPDDLRRFIDEAHRLGLGVIHDVVYNHFGPQGNYIRQFSDDFFSTRHATEWGEAINFDGDNCQPVREFFIANAGYWIDEYHFDGLRMDAVQVIMDDSPVHVVSEIARRVREAAQGRGTLMTIENELQQARFLRPENRGGYGIDAAWNDDFHHAARVAMTGRAEFYYSDYRGTPQEILSAIQWGYLYQGQWNDRQGKPRGTPSLDVGGRQFITFLQNHDQVGNSPHGRRLHEQVSPGRMRAMTALLLLAPGTPLLFQGQEFAASSAFLYFADHADAKLGKQVRLGRMEFMKNFRSMAGADAGACFSDPCDREAFVRSKLDLSERDRHDEALALHRDLLRLRRDDPMFSAQRSDRVAGAVLSGEAFALRFIGEAGEDRLLLVNLGHDLEWNPSAEPLLAPPDGTDWQLMWSSEDPRYGGSGTGPIDTRHWYFPGHTTIVLWPRST